MRKWDHVSHDELLSYIEYLKHNFDPSLSRKVIELFHERMQADEHVDPDLLYMLVKHVFSVLMEGRSADQALGLKLIKGRYGRKDAYERDLRAAAIVVLNLRKKVKFLDAVADSASHLAISESTVTRACKELRAALELLPDDVLLQVADLSLQSP